MIALLRPSLVRRIVAALLLAFALAWVAILAESYVDTTRQLKDHSGLLLFGRQLNSALAGIARSDVATAVVETEIRQINAARAENGVLPGDVLLQLRDDRDGTETYASPSIRGQRLPGELDRTIDVALDGKPYWLYEGRSGQWHLWAAEPRLDSAAILLLIERELRWPFLIAFPCLLVPVWLAVSRGLKPLRALGARLEGRATGDLSPLGVAPRHAELAPLVTALDALLMQLRAKVERERAFVGEAAHELRTPLAVISAQAHVLARSTDPAQQRDAARHLEHAVARSSHLVAQLLDLATLDGADGVERPALDVAELTQRLVAQAAPAAAARRVELTLEAPEALVVRVAPAPYESVLRNLLDNAVKYAGDGAQVTVTLARESAVLQLAVADDGPGIAAAERGLVFERFHRGTRAAVGGSGAGLGLSIVRQACLRMGGTIALKDNPAGSGCLFEATIPALER